MQIVQTIDQQSTDAITPATTTWLGLLAIYLQLAKARLTAMVLVTTAVGFLLASTGPINWQRLIWAILGTALTGAGASGLNQCLEAPSDARMPRTRNRPVAAQRISRRHAFAWSICTTVAGVLLVIFTVNLQTAALAAAAAILYVLAYTPLKQRNPICTLIGAVVGALPPMIGWAACTGSLATGAWALGAILFVWQIPHSLSLAWLYREDYARGGYHILSWNDPTGRKTFHMIVLYCLCLLAISFGPFLIGLTGTWYAAGATVLGLWLVILALQLQRSAKDADARKLFLATVIYLPILLALLLGDRT